MLRTITWHYLDYEGGAKEGVEVSCGGRLRDSEGLKAGGLKKAWCNYQEFLQIWVKVVSFRISKVWLSPSNKWGKAVLW